MKVRKEIQTAAMVPKALEDMSADDEENNDGAVVQPAGVVINMPALPPPIDVAQAPVAAPADAPNNAAGNPIVAPNQVADLQAPLINPEIINANQGPARV
jgi:hypothetical protein